MGDQRLSCFQRALETLDSDESAVEVLWSQGKNLADPQGVNVLKRKEEPIKL